MLDNIGRLKTSSNLQEMKKILDEIFNKLSEKKLTKKSLFLKIFDYSIFNYNIIEKFQTKMIVDYLITKLSELDSTILNSFYNNLIFRLNGYFIKIIKNCLDIGHFEILEFIERLDIDSESKYMKYMKLASILSDILNDELKHSKFTDLERERIAKILADLHGIYLLKHSDEEIKKKFHLKFQKNYKNSILNFQKLDLEKDLLNSRRYANNFIINMSSKDYKYEFIVNSPLRLGLSSANASDNHTRAKEKGSRALNTGIYLSLNSKQKPDIPIIVKVKRIEENRLKIKSIDLQKEFILTKKDSNNKEEFFKYRNKQDELQLLKQALIYTGIINVNTKDPLIDIIEFTNGGGLELITNVKIFTGTGLGTSSILSAALLMCLYRISGQSRKMNYPTIYDESILLEQSIGFNSGYQDARGAMGGKSAIKHFITNPTKNLPEPIVEFIDVDEKLFNDRIILFYTGIRRFATPNLNTVLETYLSRDFERYPAIKESFIVHNQMLQSLKNDDYSNFGNNCNQYWNLRKTIDPSATNEKLDFIFNKLEKSNLIEGGLITGAGGGGFAVLISKENKRTQLIETLNTINLKDSFVANYELNKNGINLDVKKIQ